MTMVIARAVSQGPIDKPQAPLDAATLAITRLKAPVNIAKLIITVRALGFTQQACHLTHYRTTTLPCNLLSGIWDPPPSNPVLTHPVVNAVHPHIGYERIAA